MGTESGNPGIEIEIGITEKRLARQLAATEARFVKSTNAMQGSFDKSNRAVAKSFEVVDTAAKGLTGSNGLRQVALQLSQVGQQGSVTGNYIQALAIQMPDLLLAFGTFGAILGAAVGFLSPFVIGLFKTDDAMNKLVDSLNGGSIGLDSIRGSISQLHDLQDRYTQAIEASAVASGNTAATVAASSKREFEARRQVLEIEAQLLRLRSQEQRANLSTMQQDYRDKASKEAAIRTSDTFAGNPANIGLDPYVYTGPRNVDEVLGKNFAKDTEAQTLAIQRLNAEIRLTDLAAEEAGRSLSKEFGDSVGGVAAKGGNTDQQALADLATRKDLIEKTRTATEAYGIKAANLNDLFKRGVIDADLYKRSMDDLDATLEKKTSSGGGKGGGSASLNKQQQQDLKAASDLYKSTATNAEAYKNSVARLDDLLARGVITAELHERAINDLNAKYADLKQAGAAVGNTLANAFDSAINQGKGLKEVLADLLTQMGSLYLKQGAMSLGESLISGGGGSKLISAAISLINPSSLPAHANGTRSAPGGLSLVGEKGPELVNLRPGSSVTSNRDLQNALNGGSAGVHVTVSVNDDGKLVAIAHRTAVAASSSVVASNNNALRQAQRRS